MSGAHPFPFDPTMATEVVARALLGATLHVVGADGTHVAGRIVETEAYLGLEDPACHSFHGRRTPRVASLYLPAGHAYVYRSYGVHWCLNVVTRGAERPEAVLVRAVRPELGLAAMRARRGEAVADRDLARGPGNLTRAFGIDGAHDGQRLDCGSTSIEDRAGPPAVGRGRGAARRPRAERTRRATGRCASGFATNPPCRVGAARSRRRRTGHDFGVDAAPIGTSGEVVRYGQVQTPGGPSGPSGPPPFVALCGQPVRSRPPVPLRPCGPGRARRPCGPAGPWGPAGPGNPIGPVAPVGPAGPIAPVAPVAPAGPAGPVKPVGP